MTKTQNYTKVKRKVGITTRIMATICHKCNICPIAERRPHSTFGRIMRWHRTWCPAWAAHVMIYGRKPLSQ